MRKLKRKVLRRTFAIKHKRGLVGEYYEEKRKLIHKNGPIEQ